MNALGSFVFDCGQTARQTNKQTKPIHVPTRTHAYPRVPTRTDFVGVGSNRVALYWEWTPWSRCKKCIILQNVFECFDLSHLSGRSRRDMYICSQSLVWLTSAFIVAAELGRGLECFHRQSPARTDCFDWCREAGRTVEWTSRYFALLWRETPWSVSVGSGGVWIFKAWSAAGLKFW